MVRLTFIVFTLIASIVHGAPLSKRIAQSIASATAKWEQACIAAGGAQRCNPVSVAAFSTLLAAPGPCEQQKAADNMIDLAKTLGGDADMIRLAQIFTQQPRNTPTSQSVQYCQEAPKNPELNGLFQCQFAGANPTVFVGGIAVGQPETIPFGLNGPLNPPGSCPANPTGPLTDGTQLIDTTQNPGIGASPKAPTPIITSATGVQTSVAIPAPSVPVPASGGSDLKLQNGKDAQKLNAKFATLSVSSPCAVGELACVGSEFAQCVNGKFVTTSCGALQCVALPLVNAPGTSITCTTEADAIARISASGATGGVTGTDRDVSPPNNSAPATLPVLTVPTPAAPVAGGFKAQNGKAAQALNAKFANLSANSPCNPGDQACIGDGFAQCVGGKFVIMSCGATLTCAALPLVNAPGTSIACTTAADAAARIEASGAAGGITGA
ncbi:hypothetical protein BDZ94DRAFT_654465 [Collybia nuda]|uniref:Proline-rich protein n=1 Tax=Collybia nuda TaxID=64659 RepID=A0A9P6CJH9_9AGAR|nr:hypothetical protein BDZ94DRAFT_654465 [Collybia nuda]